MKTIISGVSILFILLIWMISMLPAENAWAGNECNGFNCPTGDQYICCSGSSGWGPWKETWEFYKGPNCPGGCEPGEGP